MIPSPTFGPRNAFRVLLFLLFLAPAVRAAEPSDRLEKVTTVEGITEYRLDNGLRVLLLPDASRPLVTVNLTVFVGSRHEGYGEAGMAHLLEHMLFKGTPLHPEIPKALRDHGADFNGTTWVDRTNYFETMPASDENLEFGIRLEADRLVNSYVKREHLASEMTVVRNEFERGENSPTNILEQRMLATAFEWHNYGKSTIGNRSDIERVPIENLQAFYKRHYRPDNAMLIVAGKFDQQKALEYIVRYFGALKSAKGELPDTYTVEPPQDGERFITLRRVGTVGAVGAVYHIPAAAHPDYPAVAVLEDILTGAPSGRLYKALVESKKASSLGGIAYAWHDPGLLRFIASCEADKNAEVRETMIDVLESLEKRPVTQEEVDRAKRRFAREYEQLLAASDRLAIELSEWAACGDWRLFFLNRDRTEKVTPEDVTRVAAQYLKRSNRTVGEFVPTKEPQRAEIPPSPEVVKILEGYTGRADLAQGEAFNPTPANIEQRIVRGTVADGVKFGLLPKKTRGEILNLRLVLRFGNEESLKGYVSACDFVGPMLTRGTEKYTRQELSDELAKLGADLSVGSDLGVLAVSLKVKRENLPAALALMREVLRAPTFPAEEFDILKRQQLESLKRGLVEPSALASNLFRRKLNPYPPEDVRHVPTLEQEIDRVGALTVEKVKELYQAQVSGQHGELAAVGDFEPDAVRRTVAETLKGWESETEYRHVGRVAQPREKGEREVILTPDKANAVYLGGLVFPMTEADPDYPALVVGNYLLGAAPLASRLSNRVRGEEGLSYTIGSFASAGERDAFGQFGIFAITNPLNIRKVDAAVLEELNKFLKEGVPLPELDQGKAAYLQQLQVERGDDASLARQIATNLYAGRTFAFHAALEEKIRALSPEAVVKTFRKVVDPKRLTVIEAGDFKKEKE